MRDLPACASSKTHTSCVIPQGKTLLKNMYSMFIERDCTLVEINPLAETPEGRGEFKRKVFYARGLRGSCLTGVFLSLSHFFLFQKNSEIGGSTSWATVSRHVLVDDLIFI